MVVRVHGGTINDQMLTGNIRYFDIEEANMTVNTTAILSAANPFQVTKAETVVGGTGYSVTNVLTVVGGTGTAATLTVEVVDAGVVVGVSLTTPGSYTVLPTNPVATTGGAGTATFNLSFTSSLIIPGAGTGALEYFVARDKPVALSAVDQVLFEVAKLGTIVQIAIVDVDTVRVALENDSMSWDTPAAGDAAAELEDAIQALGTITVPDVTSNGLDFNLAAATVTERTLASFAP